MRSVVSNVRIYAVILPVLMALSGSWSWAETPVQVTVSILPQKYFVEKIGGDRVKVAVMVPPGAEPHAFEPKPQQLIALSNSRIYFAAGMSFEQSWLDRFKAVNSTMRIVHTDDGIDKIPMDTGDKNEREEHSGHDDLYDPHVWLSPPLVRKQAEHIYTALVSADPGNREFYTDNYNRFLGELDDLDRYLKERLSVGSGHTRFMVFHPSWGYFARAYGLEQIPVEIGGKEPKPADLVRLIDTAKRLGIKVVFVQPQFSDRNARTIADAIGGKVIYADPLAENWEQNLKDVAEKMSAALR
ncbi:zinc ABC transporter substrate-binding protein [bacterium]|nr:zinc ABC transporter substrate-binding protein [bacterium]